MVPDERHARVLDESVFCLSATCPGGWCSEKPLRKEAGDKVTRLARLPFHVHARMQKQVELKLAAEAAAATEGLAASLEVLIAVRIGNLFLAEMIQRK